MPLNRTKQWCQQFASMLSFFAVFLCLCGTGTAVAAPEAHILRIDPRAAKDNGSPVLTTVIELVENKRMSDATMHCGTLSGAAQLSCMSTALEKPYALYTPFPFPAANAVLTLHIDSGDTLATYVSHTRWGESQQQPGVGTAWLILIDADSRMGSSFRDAKEVAQRFVASMGPSDIVNIIFINDRMVTGDSRWLPAAQKAKATSFIDKLGSTYPAGGRNRSLFTLIRQAATDSFKSLGNTDQQNLVVPLHQAMVVLSNGFGGADTLTTGAGALQLQQYMTGGRFPEDNTALPKTPVPVISIFFPPHTIDEYWHNSLDFMQNLANLSIGGFFTTLQEGEGSRAATIVDAVRTRFSKMYVVKWRVSCIASSVTQTFQLVFKDVKPDILGDSSFKDVPVGIDPTTWPLDINTQYTQESAQRQGGVYPGGSFRVFGNFCWSGQAQQAEVYFIPSGQQLPAALGSGDVDKAKQTQQQLIEMGMKGKAIEATDTYVEFEAPDKDKLLHGSGSQATVQLVIYDNKAHRMSGATTDSILQLKGASRPFPTEWVLGGALGLLVIALILVVVLRGGSSKKRRPAAAPSAPVVAGYGAPMQPVVAVNPAPQPVAHPAAAAVSPAPQPVALPAAAAVSPAPQPVALSAAAAVSPAPQPVALPAAAAVNPDFMYGPGGAPAPTVSATGPVGTAQRVTLQGTLGTFTVVAGTESRVGRDGSRCEIILTEPRVSSLHASVKLENGMFYVRDENSNNGTTINGTRAAAGQWTPVTNGSLLRFGSVEMSVHLE